MDNRKLGQLEVSPIGMGCMGFSHGYGQVPPEAYAIEAIRKAYDYGCTHFDTAEAYGKEQFYAGHNEELVGKAIEPATGRDESLPGDAPASRRFHEQTSHGLLPASHQ